MTLILRIRAFAGKLAARPGFARHGFLVVGVLMAIPLWLGITRSRTESDRILRFSLEIRNPGSRTISKGRLKFLSPLQSGDHFTLRSVNANAPLEIRTDGEGNRLGQLSLGTLAPYSSRVVDVAFTVVPKGRTTSIPKEKYLRAERYIESTDPRIVEIAKGLLGKPPMERAKAAYEWVVRNVKVAPREDVDRGARFALDRRQGDCTELAYLYTALLRAAGIPARPMAGFVTATSRLVGARDYHNWVEVSVGDRWRVVDPQKRIFMERDGDYVPVKILGTAAPELLGSRSFFEQPEGMRVTLR